eukprot:5779476-Pleurochrysis_carterae.AAC.1
MTTLVNCLHFLLAPWRWALLPEAELCKHSEVPGALTRAVRQAQNSQTQTPNSIQLCTFKFPCHTHSIVLIPQSYWERFDSNTYKNTVFVHDM